MILPEIKIPMIRFQSGVVVMPVDGGFVEVTTTIKFIPTEMLSTPASELADGEDESGEFEDNDE